MSTLAFKCQHQRPTKMDLSERHGHQVQSSNQSMVNGCLGFIPCEPEPVCESGSFTKLGTEQFLLLKDFSVS